MTHALRLALVVALALGGVPAAPAQDGSIQTETATLSVGHKAVTCMVAGQHPQIQARLVPEPYVESGRVYFHSALGDAFYYVEMASVGGVFVGTLPRPNLGAGPVTYYVEGLATNFTQTHTTETRSLVVEDEGECDGEVAAIAPAGTPVQVFSLTGSTALPPGFSGVGSVLAASGAAATTGATGSFITSTGGLILIGAVAIGVATAVVVTTGGEDPPPVSPSQ